MTILEWIYVAVGLSCSIWLFVFTMARSRTLGSPLRSNRPLAAGTCLDAYEFGLVEANLDRLDRVVVLSHCVERPTDALLSAVESNFRKGIHYTFLVSKSQRDNALDGYFKFFRAIAEVSMPDSAKSADDLIDIQHLDIEWNDFPHVFYFYIRPDGTNAVFALRGNQRREGIAESYVVQPPDSSYTLIQAILSDRPRTLKRSLPSVEPMREATSPIIKFPGKTA